MAAPCAECYERMAAATMRLAAIRKRIEAGAAVPWAEQWNAAAEAASSAARLAEWAKEEASRLWEQAVAAIPDGSD